MAVKEVEEQEVTTDKPTEDKSLEELHQQLDEMRQGETEQSEPVEESQGVDATENLSTEEPAKPDESSEETTKEESIEDIIKSLQKEAADSKKERENLQKAFARSQTELGLLRKQRDSLQQAQANQDKDEIDPYTNPDEFIDKKLSEREQRELMAQQEQQLRLQDTKDYIESRIPKFNDLVEDISVELGEILGDEPNRDEYVNSFKQNPYAANELVLLFAGRAAQLKRELSDLKVKAGDSAKDKRAFVDKANKLGRVGGTVNGGGGHASSNGDNKVIITDKQTESMGLDDLWKTYRQLTTQ